MILLYLGFKSKNKDVKTWKLIIAPIIVFVLTFLISLFVFIAPDLLT